jgi:hypothetical protein
VVTHAARLGAGGGAAEINDKRLLGDVLAAEDAADRANLRPRGRPENVYSEKSDVHISERPSGNSRVAALRRLRKDRQSLTAPEARPCIGVELTGPGSDAGRERRELNAHNPRLSDLRSQFSIRVENVRHVHVLGPIDEPP